MAPPRRRRCGRASPVMPVARDRVGHPQGQRERRAALHARHAASRSPRTACTKLGQLEPERVGLGRLERDLLHDLRELVPVPGRQLGRSRRKSPRPVARSSERYPVAWKIRSRRTRSPRHARGGDRRHRAARELDPRVGHVEVGGEHRDPDAADVGDLRRPGEGEEQVEVVDHQVEHHRDVGAARLEQGASRSALDVQGIRPAAGWAARTRAVEALDVAHLQRRRRPARRRRSARRPRPAWRRAASP